MKAATINEIKQELHTVSPAILLDLCVRLAKYKKENKELLSYLLFEAHNEQGFIESVKAEIDSQFAEINQGNVFFAKKGLRKILRTTTKYIRYTGSRQAEIELLLYYTNCIKLSSIPVKKSTQLVNLYQSQLKKINAAISTMHEDLQYDYRKQAEKLI